MTHDTLSRVSWKDENICRWIRKIMAKVLHIKNDIDVTREFFSMVKKELKSKSRCSDKIVNDFYSLLYSPKMNDTQRFYVKRMKKKKSPMRLVRTSGEDNQKIRLHLAGLFYANLYFCLSRHFVLGDFSCIFFILFLFSFSC